MALLSAPATGIAQSLDFPKITTLLITRAKLGMVVWVSMTTLRRAVSDKLGRSTGTFLALITGATGSHIAFFRYFSVTGFAHKKKKTCHRKKP